MKKLLTIVHLVLLLHSAAAQITVRGTNQFFTGKTPSGGNVLVFLYPEEAVFVWGQSGSYEKITVKFSTQDYKEIFIAGNIFGGYMRSSFYAYDLDKLLQKQNDNKTLSDTRSRSNIIDNISSMIVNNENIFYIQNNQLYQYRMDEKTGVKVNVTISGKDYERVYLAYNPVLDDLKKEYDLVNAEMKGLVERYNQISQNTRSVASIGNAPGSSRTLNGLYNMVKANLLSLYSFDVDMCTRYFTLAAIMGKITEANTVIRGLQKRLDSPITELYFSAIDKYNRLTAPEELSRRQKSIEDEYNNSRKIAEATRSTEKNRAENLYSLAETAANIELLKWGGDIAGIISKVALLVTKEQNLRSIRFINNDYVKNRDTIGEFDPGFFNIDTRSNLYADYSAMMEVIDHLDAAYNAKIPGYDSPVIRKLRLDNQKDVIEKQIKMAIQGLNDYAKKDTQPGLRIGVSGALEALKAAWKSYDDALERSRLVRDSSIEAAERKYNAAIEEAEKKRNDKNRSIQSDLNNEIAAVSNNIEENFLKLADYLLKRFINDELYRQARECVNSISVPSSYDSKSADYCVIQETEKRIQGFKVDISLNLDDFIDLKDNSGERYKLAQPASYYSIVSAVPGAAFVAASAKEIYAWDLTSIIIPQKPMPPETISEGIFYLLKSDTTQYVVTKAGSIIRLGISGGRITQSQLSARVSGNDTVFISTVSGKDKVYILGSNGSINGRDSGSIEIGGTQSSVITLRAANGQFTIQ
jgi:hypothetical protein